MHKCSLRQTYTTANHLARDLDLQLAALDDQILRRDLDAERSNADVGANCVPEEEASQRQIEDAVSVGKGHGEGQGAASKTGADAGQARRAEPRPKKVRLQNSGEVGVWSKF